MNGIIYLVGLVVLAILSFPGLRQGGAGHGTQSDIGGAVAAAAIAGLLTTFGAALGLATVSAEPGATPFGLRAIVTALWIVISLVTGYLAGGYVAGRMRRRVDDADAEEIATRDGINGLVVRGLGMPGWMAAVAIGGPTSAVGTAGAVGLAVGGAAPGASGWCPPRMVRNWRGSPARFRLPSC